MSNILITGAAGFIGSNLCNYFFEKKIPYEGVDDLSNGNVEFVKNKNKLHICDFSDETILKKIKNKDYEYVVHLAANPRVGYSVEFPLESNDTNVTKTLKLLDASKNNIKRFIFASSSSVYGNTDKLPSTENDSLNPNSPYGLQKLIIEQYLKLYYKLYGLDSVSLRFFNVYGDNQLGGSPYATAVASWLTAIKSGKQMRSDGDGSQTRDMCHVLNVIDCVHRSINYDNKLEAESINVATGQSISNNEILNYLLKRYPESKKYDSPWRKGDVMHTLASVEKAKNILGYEPIIRFENGLEKTADWYDKNWELVSGYKQKV
jgi:nucleoside-diphosphate-sugar epimerase